MAERVPRLEQHLLNDCGHWLQGQQSEQVNALLLEFLARHYPAHQCDVEASTNA